MDQLVSISGVGATIASRVIGGLELGRRLYDKTYRENPKISSTADAKIYFDEIRLRQQESLMAAFLNARYEVIAKETISIGGIDSVGINVRTVIYKSLQHNAYGVVLAHNHPSGDPKPSSADIEATAGLARACKLFDIKLIDHIIVARDGFSSVPL